MNKFMLAFALGAGLTLSLAPSSAQADSMINTLSMPSISAAQFNSEFTPLSSTPTPLTQNFQIHNASNSKTGDSLTGVIQSQVFKGQGAFGGLDAYAYQVSVSPNTTDSTTMAPVHVDGTSFIFNATPTLANLTGSGTQSAAYIITGGNIGGIKPLNGTTPVDPNSLSWQADSTGSSTNPYTGTLRANFVNTTTNTPPLYSGSDSATFVVLTSSTQPPPAQNFVNITSNQPQVGALTAVYSADGTVISPSPVPEPATILAWAGMAGAVALVRRVRKSRPAIA
jgi:hypothetical protein